MLILLYYNSQTYVKLKTNKNMAKEKTTNLSSQFRHLYEWAEERFFMDEGNRFLEFCKRERGLYGSELVSYTDFLILKEKFEE